uniref:Uncharacterized protein n=1 Tax=Mastacembelus armatus TaxID=205130 RepID=A0A3Q3LG12_9TELE
TGERDMQKGKEDRGGKDRTVHYTYGVRNWTLNEKGKGGRCMTEEGRVEKREFDAGFSTCCEVTVHLDGVSYAALVWINPVFTCERNTGVRHTQWYEDCPDDSQYGNLLQKFSSRRISIVELKTVFTT